MQQDSKMKTISYLGASGVCGRLPGAAEHCGWHGGHQQCIGSCPIHTQSRHAFCPKADQHHNLQLPPTAYEGATTVIRQAPERHCECQLPANKDT
eukprot:scaffold135334_cov21-Prasinocladus_malaysianus.AAC.1